MNQSRRKYCQNFCSNIHFQLFFFLILLFDKIHVLLSDGEAIDRRALFVFVKRNWWLVVTLCLCLWPCIALLFALLCVCFANQRVYSLTKNERLSRLMWLGELHWLLQYILSRRLFGRVSVKRLRNFPNSVLWVVQTIDTNQESCIFYGQAQKSCRVLCSLLHIWCLCQHNSGTSALSYVNFTFGPKLYLICSKLLITTCNSFSQM